MVSRTFQWYRRIVEKIMIIYVAGYPKSGTTWITRLLGDALSCNTGGSIPAEDKKEIATEVYGDANITVRKGHFVLMDTVASLPVIKPHRLQWKGLSAKHHKVVLVVRDPRDIVVSGAFHWKVSTRDFLDDMIKGTNGMRTMGPWFVFMREWLVKYKKFDAVIVRYEDLLQGPASLQKLLEDLRFIVNNKMIAESYERQNFQNRVIDVIQNGHKYNLGRAFNLRFMRKGVAGDWRNHFTYEEASDAESYFGELLSYFNYESDPLWWKEMR